MYSSKTLKLLKTNKPNRKTPGHSRWQHNEVVVLLDSSDWSVQKLVGINIAFFGYYKNPVVVANSLHFPSIVRREAVFMDSVRYLELILSHP